jgi:Repeat of unknown function (DUF346)
MIRNAIAVASWGSNRLDIFSLGTDNRMYHKAWDGRAWLPSPTDWEPLGGVFNSPPAVASWGSNRLDIFGLGTDNRMYHKAWDGRAWLPSPTDWEPLGGVFNSPPAVASWGSNRLDIFGLGTDNRMYHKAWDGRAWLPSPTDWEPLGGVFNSPPAVASWGSNRLDIFGLGTDNRMYHKAWDGRSWVPSATDWGPLGGVFNSPPAVASWGSNRLDIVGLGTDNRMYHKAWDGRAWLPSPTDWEPLGGVFNSPPAIASWGSNRLDIFGLGAEDRMYHKAWDGRVWLPSPTDWEPLGGVFNSPPAVASWGSNRLDIFSLGTDDQMYHKTWDGNKWLPSPTGWEPLGGVFKSFRDPISVDPNIKWEETTEYSIRVNKDLNAWHAGHLNDVLLRVDGIFVASDTGGVWGIDPDQPDARAGCVTDGADNPNVTCLAFGPDTPLQIYAGCGYPGALLVGGFESWSSIPMMDADGAPLDTRGIFRIATLKSQRAIVLATGTGVYWSDLSRPGQRVFRTAAGLPPAGYSGMAVAPDESIAVSMWGDGTIGGLFVGSWSRSGLTFTPAALPQDVSALEMRRTSLAACDSNPNVMYAIAAGPDNCIYRILRSDSGGKVWRSVPNTAVRVVRNKTNPLAPDTPSNDMAGQTGWYTNCIAVGSNDPNLVAVGWANGPWISKDAGTTSGVSHWTLRYEQDGGGLNDHVHGDIHAILFDPGDATGQIIYVASDGGLMRTFDQAGDRGYESKLSAHLRNLQFYRGGIAASPVHGGLVAGPTQDNGNVFCALDGEAPNAWQRLEGGDGVTMRFLSNGFLLDVSPNDPPPLFRKARLSRWDGTSLLDRTEIPVRRPGAEALTVTGEVAAVEIPRFKNPDTQKLMYAVAATQNVIGQLKTLYGLFSDGTIAGSEWELIATLPLNRDDAIVSVASLRGDQVFVGTKNSRVFSLAPFQEPFELAVTPTDKGPIGTVVVVRDALAFALIQGSTTSSILQSDFFSWDALGSSSNVARGVGLETDGEAFTALAIDRGANPPNLFAATDSRVFVSRDLGDTWLLATKGLPKRPHCNGLGTGAPRKDGGRYMYLGTWGRSVWQARLA